MTTSHPGNPRVFEGGQRTLFYSLVWFGGLFLAFMALPFLGDGEAGDALAAELAIEDALVIKGKVEGENYGADLPAARPLLSLRFEDEANKAYPARVVPVDADPDPVTVELER